MYKNRVSDFFSHCAQPHRCHNVDLMATPTQLHGQVSNKNSLIVLLITRKKVGKQTNSGLVCQTKPLQNESLAAQLRYLSDHLLNLENLCFPATYAKHFIPSPDSPKKRKNHCNLFREQPKALLLNPIPLLLGFSYKIDLFLQSVDFISKMVVL